MLDHFIAKNATAHKLKVNSYYTLAISYCTFCVGKHTILGPVLCRRCVACRYTRMVMVVGHLVVLFCGQ